MSKCSKIPSPHDIAHKSLRSGETVLWEGKPRHPFFIHRGMFGWSLSVCFSS